MATFLFVVPRFHTNLFFATRALIAAGHRVEVAVAKIAGTEDHSHVTPVEIGAEPARVVLNDLVRRIRPDLMIVRGSDRLLGRAGIAGRRYGARVLTYNLRPTTRVTPPGRRLRGLLMGRPWKRITPVPGLDASARQDPAAILVPFPVAAMPHTVSLQPPGDPVRILCVGKLAQRRKNQHLVIDALRRLAGFGRDVRLTIVGSSGRSVSGADEGHYDYQMDAARDTDWIDIRADLPFAEMASVYAAHDICVLPSVGEPLGAAPIEGMAYGTIPVISTGAGAAGLIVDGETGFRVDVTEPGALEQAFRRLIDEPDLRARMSDAARRVAATELSPETYVARMEALLPRRAGGGRAVPRTETNR